MKKGEAVVRLQDKEARRKEILSLAIEHYLKSAQPVSSESLRKAHNIDLSSASVRNVFSELEEIGLLTHPHTSAGRVPTDEGYRYYLNVLMRKKELSREEVDFINRIYSLKVREFDELLFETSRIMSDFTHYVSFVYFYGEEIERFYFQGIRYLLEHPEFSDVRRAHMVLEALERQDEMLDLIRRQFTDQTTVYIGKECDCPQMEYCSVIVSRYAEDESGSGRLALIGPKRMAYDQVIPLVDYISETVARNIERF